MKWRGALAGYRHLLCGLLQSLITVLQHAGTLEVQMGSQMTAFLNQNVWLPCNISGYYNRELDIKKMAVTWYLRTPGENKGKILYSVVSGEHSSHRHGLQMIDSKLKRGNAELFLPQIQLNEEGTYVCSVIVTPDKAEGTKIIEIVDVSCSLEQIPALPEVYNHIGTLSPSSIREEVLNPLKIECVTSSPVSGENVTLRCFVHGKRADEAAVSWYKGLFPVDDKIENINGNDGSYFISYVTFKTEEEERECEIRCEVSVDAEYWEETYVLELREGNNIKREATS